MLSKYETLLNVCMTLCTFLFSLRNIICIKHFSNYTKQRRRYVYFLYFASAESALLFMYMYKTTCRHSLNLRYAFLSLICKTTNCKFSDSHCFVLAIFVTMQTRSMVFQVLAFSKTFVTKLLSCFSNDMRNCIDDLVLDSHFSMPCQHIPVSTTALVFYCYFFAVIEALLFINHWLDHQASVYYRSILLFLQLLNMQPKNLLASFYSLQQKTTSATPPARCTLTRYIYHNPQINNKQMPEQSTVQFYLLCNMPFCNNSFYG